jgi:hypothetical protein
MKFHIEYAPGKNERSNGPRRGHRDRARRPAAGRPGRRGLRQSAAAAAVSTSALAVCRHPQRTTTEVRGCEEIWQSAASWPAGLCEREAPPSAAQQSPAQRGKLDRAERCGRGFLRQAAREFAAGRVHGG